jgi:hypothetical protein
MRRVASRYDWTRVTPPLPFGGTHSTAIRYYIANPTPELALNAWRAGGYWRWGILAFVDGTALIFRQGSAPTLGEAKLRAEAALPDKAHPQAAIPWDGTLPTADYDPFPVPF